MRKENFPRSTPSSDEVICRWMSIWLLRLWSRFKSLLDAVYMSSVGFRFTHHNLKSIIWSNPETLRNLYQSQIPYKWAYLTTMPISCMYMANKSIFQGHLSIKTMGCPCCPIFRLSDMKAAGVSPVDAIATPPQQSYLVMLVRVRIVYIELIGDGTGEQCLNCVYLSATKVVTWFGFNF